MMDYLREAIDFLTDPSGIGFPILIGAGLGVVLYLMRVSMRGWQKTDRKMAEHAASEQSKKYPFKPF